jgi:hypothetical protein
MQELYIGPTGTTPEVHFAPREDTFLIRGISSPEDVRAMYYPVLEWITQFVEENISSGGRNRKYTIDSPLIFKVDLVYLNSSSAKFLYDIVLELKKLKPFRIPFIIEWFFDEDDTDLMEAGSDIASLAEMEFSFISK